MTKEDKGLLLKDLCGRLPYGVIVRVSGEWFYDKEETHDCKLSVQNDRKLARFMRDECEIKPYLRPMSSMTEEEVKEIQKISWQFCKPKNDLYECFVGDADDGYCSVSQMSGILDYLNANHFDYRGLIPLGLAIAVTEENNPYK